MTKSICCLLTLLCVGAFYVGCSKDVAVTTGTVFGTVTDSRGGEPLEGVMVTVSPANASYKTGSDGKFEFQNLPIENNPYTIQVELENYRTNNKAVTVKVGESVLCDISMTQAAPELKVSQNLVEFVDDRTTYSIDVLNEGDAELHWSVSEDVSWLSCVPSSGNVRIGGKQAVTLNVDRAGLSSGTYSQTISFNSDDGGHANVEVKLFVQGISVKVSPEILEFGTAVTTLQLTMTGGDNVSYSLVPSNAWILPSKTSGVFSKTENLTVAVNRTGLTVGDYTGSLSLRVGEHRLDIPVRMSIIPKTPPTVSLLGVEGVTHSSALFRGAVLSLGSSSVLRHGFCWGETEEPLALEGNSCNFGDCSAAKEMTYTASSLKASTVYYVRAYAENNDGISYSGSQRFATSDVPQKPEVETGSMSLIQADRAAASGNLLKVGVDVGVSQYGHVWSTSPAPTINDAKSLLGTRTEVGSYTSQLTGLKPNTVYYVRAYATNTLGTSYGGEVSFTTMFDAVSLNTSSPSNVTHNSATLGGIVTDDGGNSITEQGVCWATSQHPTVSDSRMAAPQGEGAFSVRVEALAERTLYHVRAYAVAGDGTVYYGNDVAFQTTHQIYLPQVSGVTVSNIKVTASTLRATLTNDGDGTVTDAGFVYATHTGPSVADEKVSCGVQTGAFSSVLDKLKEHTIYYVRAYATNEAGTNYGEETTFTTLEIKQPVLSAVTVSGVSHKSASFAAQVEQTNNGTLTEVGFVYSINPNPGLTNHKVTCGTDLSFSGRTSSLTANTTYYVRAYATNEKGTAFSEQMEFRTKEEPEDSSLEVGDFGNDQKWD